MGGWGGFLIRSLIQTGIDRLLALRYGLVLLESSCRVALSKIVSAVAVNYSMRGHTIIGTLNRPCTTSKPV